MRQLRRGRRRGAFHAVRCPLSCFESRNQRVGGRQACRRAGGARSHRPRTPASTVMLEAPPAGCRPADRASARPRHVGLPAAREGTRGRAATSTCSSRPDSLVRKTLRRAGPRRGRLQRRVRDCSVAGAGPPPPRQGAWLRRTEQRGFRSRPHRLVQVRRATCAGHSPARIASRRTGRSHQLRVHLQSIGHPIVGDADYGGEAAAVVANSSPELQAAQAGVVGTSVAPRGCSCTRKGSSFTRSSTVQPGGCRDTVASTI